MKFLKVIDTSNQTVKYYLFENIINIKKRKPDDVMEIHDYLEIKTIDGNIDILNLKYCKIEETDVLNVIKDKIHY